MSDNFISERNSEKMNGNKKSPQRSIVKFSLYFPNKDCKNDIQSFTFTQQYDL